MPAYVIAEAEITNEQLMQEYVAKAGPTAQAYGAKTLAATKDITTLDGDWKPRRMVVIEFPSIEKARAWYDSPEYQEIIGMRFEASDGSLVLLDGLP